jgi:hypothetical protein
MFHEKCPNCGIVVGRPNEEKGGENMTITHINGISSDDPFVKKVKSIANKYEVVGCEIGHGYATFEFKYAIDMKQVDTHIQTYIASVYRGWKKYTRERYLAVIDDTYDVTQPAEELPPPIITLTEGDAQTVAPNENEEEQADGGKDD